MLEFFKKLSVGLISFFITTFALIYLLSIFAITDTSKMGYDIYDFASQDAQTEAGVKIKSLCDFFDEQIKAQGNKPLSQIKQELLSSAKDKQQVDAVFSLVEECQNNVTTRKFLANGMSKLAKAQFPENNTLQTIELVFANGHLIIAALLALLFFVLRELFLRQFGKILIKVGIPIIIIYIVLQVYAYYSPLDTTPILEAISSGLSGGPLADGEMEDGFEIDQMQIISLIVKIILFNIYTFKLFVAGSLLIIIGATIRIIFREKRLQKLTNNQRK